MRNRGVFAVLLISAAIVPAAAAIMSAAAAGADPTYQLASQGVPAVPVESGYSDQNGHVLPVNTAQPLPTAQAPTAAAGFGITPVVSSAAETGHVLKGAAGNLYSARYTNLAALAGFLATINATAVPSSSASISPVDCVPVAANGFVEIDYSPGPPDVYSAGITAIFSTSCTIYTPSTGSGLFKGRVQ